MWVIARFLSTTTWLGLLQRNSSCPLKSLNQLVKMKSNTSIIKNYIVECYGKTTILPYIYILPNTI